jgi:hypothetical protein
MRTKTVLLVISAICIAYLSGCVSGPKTANYSNMVWYQPGASAEETRRDLAVCQNEALVNGRAYSPVPAERVSTSILLGMMASSSENNRENEIVQTCMIAKGYTLVDTNSPLLTNNLATGQQLDSTINAKLLGHWRWIPPSKWQDIRGELNFYFLPQNRYEFHAGLMDTNGRSLTTYTLQAGRYYFTENKLVTWGDKDDKPSSPTTFFVTDTQLSIQLENLPFIFQKESR